MSISTIPAKLRLCLPALIALLFLTISQTPSQAQQFQDGRHYLSLPAPLATSSPGKIEVAYMFSYSSPHSNHNEPTMQRWSQRLPNDINLIYIPVGWSAPMALDRQVFYTLQMLGELGKYHQTAFDTHHQQRQRVGRIDDWARLFQNHGLNYEKFKRAANSFQVQSMVQKADVFSRSAGVRGIPSIVVNGQYLVTTSSIEDALRVTNYLVSQIRAQRNN